MEAQRNRIDTTPAILRKYLDGVEESLDELLSPNNPDMSIMLKYHHGLGSTKAGIPLP